MKNFSISHTVTQWGAIAAGLSLVAAASATERAVPADYATIQAAIDAALPGDVVVVANGTYTGAGNRDLNFNGKAITVRSAGGAANCVIDCQGSTTDPHRGVAFQDGETAASVFQGFTIRNGATAVGAVSDPFNGAAILCANASSPTIRDCILTNNVAACWGGAICCSSGAAPTVSGCNISHNSVGDDGGAIFVWGGGNPMLINCLLSNNTSGSTGGAMTSFGGTFSVINCTLVNNTADWGAGIYGWDLDVRNTVIWGNVGSGQIMGQPVVRHSVVQGGYAGEGNLSANPSFVDAAAEDFRLLAGSACIDAGDNTAIPMSVATDLSGASRFMNDPATMDSGVEDGVRWAADLGAYEFQGHSCPGEVNGDGHVDLADLALLLSEFGGTSGLLESDQDHDNDVDLTDLAMVLASFGTTCPN